MMRLVLVILLAFMPGLASAAAEPLSSMSKEEIDRLIKSNEESDEEIERRIRSSEEFERLTIKLGENPPYLTAKRLLTGYKIGRCLLEVQGKRLINGRCAYAIGKDGEFEIHGPRQVYAGIDYPEQDCYCSHISTDYFVQVDREILEGGATGRGWTAHWNEDKRATHAQSYLGPVTQRGACFLNDETKICLWKK